MNTQMNEIQKSQINVKRSFDLEVRSSGSVAKNYIEANESFGKKDFQYRIVQEALELIFLNLKIIIWILFDRLMLDRFEFHSQIFQIENCIQRIKKGTTPRNCQ